MRRSRLPRVVALLAATACTAAPSGAPVDPPTATASPSAAAPVSGGLWPQRPVVSLRFDVAPDLRTVTGRETVLFTPDLRTCGLVFRAWPNKPETAAAGNRLVVTAVTVDGAAVTPRVQRAGAPPGTPGTLVDVPLPSCLDPGRSVAADLRFTLRLGAGTPERVGVSAQHDMAWLGTAYPLLAWVRRSGWARDPAVDLYGEMATSEEFRLAALDVAVPAGFDVLGTGARTHVSTTGATTVHRFTAAAVRDVAVSVCRCTVVERSIGAVRLHVGAPVSGTVTPVARWADLTASALRRLAALLGPYAYTDLWVTVVPDVPSGIEFPGAIQFGDVDPKQFAPLVPHEVAHQWFYGLVGNDQGLHPWLDESFATYAEAVTDGVSPQLRLERVPAALRGLAGRPMTFWAQRPPDDYGVGVYTQGAAALAEARRSVGAARFDAALRAYIAVNAHRVVTPHDVARAFAAMPEALTLLRRAGALTG